jgi:hypothetical protein
VATSFQNQDYAPALMDFAHIFYGDGDPEPRLERRRVRWLVAPAQDGGPESLHRTLLLGEGPARKPTLYRRLFELDGSGARSSEGAALPALGRWRLVHESALPATYDGHKVPAVKIFERVAGARLEGTCDGGVVLLEAQAKSDQGRAFAWRSFAPCRDGRFAAIVPYVGSVTAQGAGWRAQTTVSDEDVLAGRAVAVVR